MEYIVVGDAYNRRGADSREAWTALGLLEVIGSTTSFAISPLNIRMAEWRNCFRRSFTFTLHRYTVSERWKGAGFMPQHGAWMLSRVSSRCGRPIVPTHGLLEYRAGQQRVCSHRQA